MKRALLCLGLAACGGFIDRQASSTTLRVLRSSLVAARRQPDVELARAAMPSGIVQLAAFAQTYPDEREFRVLHAAALCDYAIGFVFDDWEDATLDGRAPEAARLADRLANLLPACIDANLALLPPAWRAARTQGPDATIALLPSATRAHADALLAIARADAVTIALSPLLGFPRLAVTRATLTRCAELAPGAHDADAELLLATIAANLPGNTDAEALFAKARKLAGDGALLADVMFARGLAVARKDTALFHATLEAVLAADVTRWPERRLANELARTKARRYLAHEGTLLPPPEDPNKTE